MPAHTRVCATPGCPHLTTNAYCTKHERERDTKRGTTAQRGYGTDHQHTRNTLKPLVEAGATICVHPDCRQPIAPSEPWDLAHNHDRTGYLGPMHASCNRATAGTPRRGGV